MNTGPTRERTLTLHRDRWESMRTSSSWEPVPNRPKSTSLISSVLLSMVACFSDSCINVKLIVIGQTAGKFDLFLKSDRPDGLCAVTSKCLNQICVYRHGQPIIVGCVGMTTFELWVSWLIHICRDVAAYNQLLWIRLRLHFIFFMLSWFKTCPKTYNAVFSGDLSRSLNHYQNHNQITQFLFKCYITLLKVK